jgi:hypothetical protein
MPNGCTAFFLVFGHACHCAIYGLQYLVFEPMDRKIVPPIAATSAGIRVGWNGTLFPDQYPHPDSSKRIEFWEREFLHVEGHFLSILGTLPAHYMVTSTSLDTETIP